ncbi:CREB/ATF bZIP transcription factor-like isoform X2 [Paramacrobiotus metropolitanus]|uniref:CREB/ATF bZIP transcription factor-like isoform X2 n=1 Tax=Paramacrobiotus metropolitanus TaxID=2943436 RepID=UPI002445A911|nr:CREB/ATF bZIP transcription factor-like isoform X2 [Paramacrobiotus metropolitanus]
MATGHLGSPRPEVEYGQRSLTKVKQETEIPTFPAFPDGFDERKSVTPDEKITRNRTAEKGSKKAAVKSKSFSPSRPLVERHKRHSDDDGDSVSSNLTDYTDGTDGSGTDGSNHAADGRVSTDGRRKMSRRDVEGMLAAAEHGGAGDAGLPSLPKIPTVPFAENAKRQRRDVSMSAPAVAARELRLKKKQREEHLITECMDLKAEAETMERDMREARAQLDRLREDAAYLRSLVKSQQSVVDLLQYLQNAPFFNKDGHTEPGLRLDGRSILRQISGSAQDEKTAKKEQAKEIGGICLHINGSSITLHLCSHCSSEAGSK